MLVFSCSSMAGQIFYHWIGSICVCSFIGRKKYDAFNINREHCLISFKNLCFSLQRTTQSSFFNWLCVSLECISWLSHLKEWNIKWPGLIHASTLTLNWIISSACNNVHHVPQQYGHKYSTFVLGNWNKWFHELPHHWIANFCSENSKKGNSCLVVWCSVLFWYCNWLP